MIQNPNPYDVPLFENTVVGFISDDRPEQTSDSFLVSETNDPIPSAAIDVNSELPSDEQKELREIVSRNNDLFAWKISQLSRTELLQHQIELIPGSIPPFQRPYRTSQAEEEFLQQQIIEYKNAGIIEDSCSPYSSPYLFVRKKNGSWRLVHNFIKLNGITKKDKYPLPRIDDLLDHLLDQNYFSTFDLFSGFYQIELHPYD